MTTDPTAPTGPDMTNGPILSNQYAASDAGLGAGPDASPDAGRDAGRDADLVAAPATPAPVAGPDATAVAAPPAGEEKATPYAWYVLVMLVIVYVLNFVDRQILAILAEDIKRDLKMDDAEIGTLFGASFGVFYALFGIPLGRLADNWHRVKLMTGGLALWSAMTALSGFATNKWMLTAARIGVGVGEATASPSAYSLLADYFPKKDRATALAIYSSGIFLGSGLSLFLGGWTVESWNAAYPNGGPMGLVGWQAAFLVVGLPGLLLALWVATIKEPVRGRGAPDAVPPSKQPFKDFFAEVMSVIPPFTLIGAASRGVPALLRNIGFAGLSALFAFGMIHLTGKTAQWVAMGIGFYAVFSWAGALKARDLATWRLIWGTPAFIYTTIGYSMVAFTSYAISLWGPNYGVSVLGQAPKIVGLNFGIAAAAGGFLGVIAGGKLADRWRATHPAGRLKMVMVGILGPVIPLVVAMNTADPRVFYAMIFLMGLLGSSALGAAAATTQDLVQPRMRGAAAAAFFIGTTLIGLGLGPYAVGQISVWTGDLRIAILSLLAMVPIAMFCIFQAYRLVPPAEASMDSRAAE